MRGWIGTMAALAGLASLLLASPTVACTGERPAFAEAMAAAQAIARIELISEPTEGDGNRSETHAVIRVLKGSLPAQITLDDPRSTLCGDTVGFWMDEGQQAIVAYGVPFYATTLAIAWVEFAESVPRVDGSAPAPPGATTLDDIEAAIVAALPDTAMKPPRVPGAFTVAGLLMVVLAMTFAATCRRCGQSRSPKPVTVASVDSAVASGIESAHQCSRSGFTASGYEAGE